MTGALSHIRVLDLSRVLAGPWATQVFADMGAEVIKVEKPRVGDETRGWGPPFLADAESGSRDASYFLSANRGKKSLTLDIASPDGQEIVRRLASLSDVVVETTKSARCKNTVWRTTIWARSIRVLSIVRSPASVNPVPTRTCPVTITSSKAWAV